MQETLVAKSAPASKRRLRNLLAEHSLLVLATMGAALAAISSELDLHSLGKSPADAVTKAAGAPPVQAAENVSYMHLNLYMSRTPYNHCVRALLANAATWLPRQLKSQFVPLAIEAKALPLLKELLAQETEQLPIRAPISTVISCVKLISDRPLGARSVLADPLLYQAVLDAASRIMSEWCLQQERSTASSHIVTSRTCFEAMVTVANLLNAGA
eukprot:19548-Heterococcus_DN1.PRE.1